MLPTPTTLLTAIRPPCASTSRLLIAQSQPGTAEAASDAVVDLAEVLEQAVEGFLGNADAGVADPELEFLTRAVVFQRPHRYRHLHRTAAGELDGIAQQVGKHLTQAHLIGDAGGRHAVVDAVAEGDALRRSEIGDQIKC